MSVLGPQLAHDELATVRAGLCPVATVVLVDLQLAETHGCLTELTLNRTLPAFLGLLGGRQGGHGLGPAATAAGLGIRAYFLRGLKPIRKQMGRARIGTVVGPWPTASTSDQHLEDRRLCVPMAS